MWRLRCKDIWSQNAESWRGIQRDNLHAVTNLSGAKARDDKSADDNSDSEDSKVAEKAVVSEDQDPDSSTGAPSVDGSEDVLDAGAILELCPFCPNKVPHLQTCEECSKAFCGINGCGTHTEQAALCPSCQGGDVLDDWDELDAF